MLKSACVLVLCRLLWDGSVVEQGVGAVIGCIFFSLLYISKTWAGASYDAADFVQVKT